MFQRVSDTSVLTGIHLILIVILMVLTIIGIIWGSRLKRRRDAADKEEAQRVEASGIEPQAPYSDSSAAESVMDERAKPVGFPSRDTSPATGSAVPSKVEEPDEETMRAASRTSRAPEAPAPSPRVQEPTVSPPLTPAPPPLADEPVLAAAPFDASPASLAADMSGEGPRDEPAKGSVTQLKGLGPKAAALLAEQGITTVGQIAALDSDAAAALDTRLGSFSGRLARDRWVEQARFLAAGDRAGFEAVFGKL